jgi:adenylate cyclase
VDSRSERRLVTCLFVDIVGSTDATVRLGPERMRHLLNDAFGSLSDIVAEEGGVVEKYVGDAVFALFGVPVAHADDTLRALRAAATRRAASSPGRSCTWPPTPP